MKCIQKEIASLELAIDTWQKLSEKDLSDADKLRSLNAIHAVVAKVESSLFDKVQTARQELNP